MYFCTTYLVKEKNYNTIGGLILSSLLLREKYMTKCMITIFHELPWKKFAFVFLRFPISQSSSSTSS